MNIVIAWDCEYYSCHFFEDCSSIYCYPYKLIILTLYAGKDKLGLLVRCLTSLLELINIFFWEPDLVWLCVDTLCKAWILSPLLSTLFLSDMDHIYGKLFWHLKALFALSSVCSLPSRGIVSFFVLFIVKNGCLFLSLNGRALNAYNVSQLSILLLDSSC